MTPALKHAMTLEQARRLPEAERAYRAALRATPEDAEAHLAFLSFCLRVPGALPGAFPSIKALGRLRPKSDLFHRLAAQACFEIRDTVGGLDHARTAVTLAPKNPETHYVLAEGLMQSGDVQEALSETSATLDLDPDHWHVAKTRAQAFISLGRMDDAKALCRTLHSRNPDDLTVYALYARTGKLSADDPLLQDLQERLLPRVRAIGPRHAEAALKVLAKLQLDQGDYAAAFRSYAAAKAVDPMTPDRAGYRKFVEAQVSGLSRADFFGWQGSDDDRPVFVVGMPRSGSTLLEQILSGHAAVGGIGESTMINKQSRAFGIGGHNGPQMVNRLKQMDPQTARALAQPYSDMLDATHPGKRRVVDKFLHNFEELAFVAKLFPKARVIHALRDPMDNCVSCYMSNLSRWHSYTQDLTTLGQFYRGHIRLMDHWKKALPNPILEVRYEDVVADTEGQARRIIDFLGLDWDPNCLKFQENENKAKTMSAWQVRQPIYTSSVKRWKRYEEFLDPLKEELKGFYPDGF